VIIWINRWLGRAMAVVPAVRTIAQYHRYAFGPAWRMREVLSTGWCCTNYLSTRRYIL
jgi:hypothetical protein